MSVRSNVLAAGVVMVLAAGCAKDESSSPTPAAQPASAPAAVPSADDAPEVTIPTQDEADAQAADAITEENADAELEKLKEEIEGGG